MKRLFTILMLLVWITASGADMITKTVDYTVPAGRVAYVNLTHAERYQSERYIIYGDIYSADSTEIARNCYWLDNRAPFILNSQAELDSLLAWRK